MLPEQEKRKYPRLGISLDVFEPGGKHLGLIKNISPCGCFLKTKQDIKENMLLSFQLPDTLERVDTLCEVEWKNFKGVGAKFILNEKNIMILIPFIKEWGVQTD